MILIVTYDVPCVTFHAMKITVHVLGQGTSARRNFDVFEALISIFFSVVDNENGAAGNRPSTKSYQSQTK